MLVKFQPPTKLDIHPFKSIWLFKHSDGQREYWIQMSEDTLKVNWQRLGLVLEQAFEWHIVNDHSFINDALRLISVRKIEIIEPES